MALGFYGWLAIGNAVLMLFAARTLRPALLFDVVRSGKRVALIGGGASLVG